LIRELAAEAVTFVLSSHLLAMMQTICSRVALFRKGRIGLIGKVEDLTSEVLGGTHMVEVEADNADLVKLLAGVPHISGVAPLKEGCWRVDADADVRADIARRIVGAGGALHSITIRRATLDKVYVRFFEGENHDVAA
jgi:ABC-2 type transport system ATP-binding protein